MRQQIADVAHVHGIETEHCTDVEIHFGADVVIDAESDENLGQQSLERGVVRDGAVLTRGGVGNELGNPVADGPGVGAVAVRRHIDGSVEFDENVLQRHVEVDGTVLFETEFAQLICGFVHIGNVSESHSEFDAVDECGQAVFSAVEACRDFEQVSVLVFDGIRKLRPVEFDERIDVFEFEAEIESDEEVKQTVDDFDDESFGAYLHRKGERIRVIHIAVRRRNGFGAAACGVIAAAVEQAENQTEQIDLDFQRTDAERVGTEINVAVLVVNGQNYSVVVVVPDDQRQLRRVGSEVFGRGVLLEQEFLHDGVEVQGRRDGKTVVYIDILFKYYTAEVAEGQRARRNSAADARFQTEIDVRIGEYVDKRVFFGNRDVRIVVEVGVQTFQSETEVEVVADAEIDGKCEFGEIETVVEFDGDAGIQSEVASVGRRDLDARDIEHFEYVGQEHGAEIHLNVVAADVHSAEILDDERHHVDVAAFTALSFGTAALLGVCGRNGFGAAGSGQEGTDVDFEPEFLAVSGQQRGAQVDGLFGAHKPCFESAFSAGAQRDIEVGVKQIESEIVESNLTFDFECGGGAYLLFERRKQSYQQVVGGIRRVYLGIFERQQVSRESVYGNVRPQADADALDCALEIVENGVEFAFEDGGDVAYRDVYAALSRGILLDSVIELGLILNAAELCFEFDSEAGKHFVVLTEIETDADNLGIGKSFVAIDDVDVSDNGNLLVGVGHGDRCAGLSVHNFTGEDESENVIENLLSKFYVKTFNVEDVAVHNDFRIVEDCGNQSHGVGDGFARRVCDVILDDCAVAYLGQHVVVGSGAFRIVRVAVVAGKNARDGVFDGGDELAAEVAQNVVEIDAAEREFAAAHETGQINVERFRRADVCHTCAHGVVRTARDVDDYVGVGVIPHADTSFDGNAEVDCTAFGTYGFGEKAFVEVDDAVKQRAERPEKRSESGLCVGKGNGKTELQVESEEGILVELCNVYTLGIQIRGNVDDGFVGGINLVNAEFDVKRTLNDAVIGVLRQIGAESVEIHTEVEAGARENVVLHFGVDVNGKALTHESLKHIEVDADDVFDEVGNVLGKYGAAGFQQTEHRTEHAAGNVERNLEFLSAVSEVGIAGASEQRGKQIFHGAERSVGAEQFVEQQFGNVGIAEDVVHRAHQSGHVDVGSLHHFHALTVLDASAVVNDGGIVVVEADKQCLKNFARFVHSPQFHQNLGLAVVRKVDGELNLDGEGAVVIVLDVVEEKHRVEVYVPVVLSRRHIQSGVLEHAQCLGTGNNPRLARRISSGRRIDGTAAASVVVAGHESADDDAQHQYEEER